MKWIPLPQQDQERSKLSKKTNTLIAAAALVLLLGFVLGLALGFGISYRGSSNDNNNNALSSLGIYSKAAVATDATECSGVARDVLMRNGSAVDASIAALLCDGLINAHSMGIGGGFFMTVYNRKQRKAEIIDAREMAPGKAFEDMYGENATLAKIGGLAVAVPSEIKGYWVAHKKYGRLPWRDLFQYAIKMCQEGYLVHKPLARAINESEMYIMGEENLRKLYINPETNALYQEGQYIKDPLLAKTLQTIANEGADALYKGKLGEKLVEDIRRFGGIITMEDMERYEVKIKEPIRTLIQKNISVYAPPPPASGPLIGFMLSILDGYHFKPWHVKTLELSVLTFHRITEAMKFTYAKRTELGDEDFIDIKSLLKNLASRPYADQIRKRIDDRRTYNESYYGANVYNADDGGTSHISVLSPDGDAVSTTSTINRYFGAKIRSPSTGIILNDEMDDFSAPKFQNSFGIPPSEANFIKAYKRPLSSMCPVILVDKNGDVLMIIGAAGGTKITSATAYVIMRTLWMEESIQKSIDAPRIHHQLFPNQLQYEVAFPHIYLNELEKIGHNVSSYPITDSIIQAIFRTKDNKLHACSDYRKGGTTTGF